jgi:glycerophosphoryl diester phosphodiesterase
VTALRLAHRGDWRLAPENSLEAMRAALANPACDGLEFDVRFSRDGMPVLLHDATLERVQGVAAPVGSLSAAELGAYGIPTLAAVLELAADRSFLDVELKEPATDAFFDVLSRARGDPAGGLARAVVSSFQPEILARVAAARPEWPRWGNSRDLEPETIGVAVGLGCSALATTWRAIEPAGIKRAKEAGLAVASWTVRRRPTFDRLERLGVTAMCVEAAALDG